MAEMVEPDEDEGQRPGIADQGAQRRGQQVGAQDPGEPSGTATKTWVLGAPATLTLAPKSDTNPVGTQHCVTATVRDAFGNQWYLAAPGR